MITDEVPNGWKPAKWEPCGERFLLIVVVNKNNNIV